MTVKEWIQIIKSEDEFPWESPDEAPDAKAMALLESLGLRAAEAGATREEG